MCQTPLKSQWLTSSCLHFPSDSHSHLISVQPETKRGICQPAFAENSEQPLAAFWRGKRGEGLGETALTLPLISAVRKEKVACRCQQQPVRQCSCCAGRTQKCFSHWSRGPLSLTAPVRGCGSAQYGGRVQSTRPSGFFLFL